MCGKIDQIMYQEIRGQLPHSLIHTISGNLCESSLKLGKEGVSTDKFFLAKFETSLYLPVLVFLCVLYITDKKKCVVRQREH